MQKKILSSLLLASALPFNAYALGLGDIEVYSALNQPLDAEISIKAATPGEVDSLLVKLASEQAFLKSGVERPFMLTKLKFRAAYKADGTPIIKVTSPKAIREPFLNFLVDVEWPRGRLVREYTVLLDPPSFSTSQPVTTASPEVTQAAATGSAPIQRAPQDQGVYGFEEPEPVAQTHAAVTEFVEEVETAAPVVEEVLTYKEPILQEEVASVEEVAETSSPFTELLNDIQTESVPEFEEPTFAASEPSVDTQFNIPTPSAAVSLNADELPELNMRLDSTIPFNAETILASDNDYVDPEIESLLRADDSYLYRESAPEPEPEVVYVTPEPTPAPVVEARPDYYEVQEGDIMYNIAEQFRPSGVDINQAMLAIMRYNPEAFINDNVNLVRKGQVLRIPDEEAMLALSSRDAVAEVRGQNALWREYKAQLAGAASMFTDDIAAADVESGSQEFSTENQSNTSTSTGEGTQLALVAPDKGQESTNAVAGEQEGQGNVRRLERNLALAKEKLAASNLEQAEVQSRINELEQIVTQSEGVIKLKNQQLAQVQANAEQANESAEQAAEVVKQVVDGTEAAAEAVQSAVDTGAEDTIAAVSAAQDDLLDGIDGVEEVAEASIETPTQVNLETPESEVVAPIEVATSTGSARPDGIGGIIYDLVPPSLRPMLKPILSGPLLFVILALPVLLLLAGLFLVLRKKKAEEPEIVFEEDNLDLETAAEEALEAVDSSADDLDSTVSLDALSDDTDVEATMVATVAKTAVNPESASSPADDDIQDDTTAEVDVYIAYGLHDQAEELLKQSIADKPEVTAYRGKLLETYFNAGKKDEFVNEAQALNEHLNGKSSAVWTKAVVMGKEIAPDNMLFSGTEVSGDLKASDFAAAKPDAADLDLGASDDDSMDLDLSADDTDLSASPEATEDVEDEFSLDDVAAELDASLDGEADEELDFDASDFAESGEGEVDLSSSDDIDLDIDGVDLDADLNEESVDDADIDLGDGDLTGDLDALLGDIGGDEPEEDLEDDAANALTGNLDDILDAAEAEEPALELSDADLDLDAAQDDVGELDLDGDSGLDIASSEDDGLDFDMADLDMSGADEADFSPDDTQGLDTQGLDDSLFDDAADSTQMIDDDSLETMVDDMDGSDSDFGFDDDMPDNLDEVGTKLDLAKAYIDMGDADGAKASLEEVIQEGNSQQKKEAEELLAQI